MPFLRSLRIWRSGEVRPDRHRICTWQTHTLDLTDLVSLDATWFESLHTLNCKLETLFIYEEIWHLHVSFWQEIWQESCLLSVTNMLRDVGLMWWLFLLWHLHLSGQCQLLACGYQWTLQRHDKNGLWTRVVEIVLVLIVKHDWEGICHHFHGMAMLLSSLLSFASRFLV